MRKDHKDIPAHRPSQCGPLSSVELERIRHQCEKYSYWRYPGAQDDMATLIAEIDRLKAEQQPEAKHDA